MNDNRSAEERAQDQEFMREVTKYFTEILGASKTPAEADIQTAPPAAPDTDNKTKNTSDLGSPHLGF